MSGPPSLPPCLTASLPPCLRALLPPFLPASVPAPPPPTPLSCRDLQTCSCLETHSQLEEGGPFCRRLAVASRFKVSHPWTQPRRCTWNHTVCGLLRLVSSTEQMFPASVHMLARVWALLINGVDGPQFAHPSPADGRSGCFHLQAVANRAAVNTHGHVCLNTCSVYLGTHPKMGLLGHVLIPFPFRGATQLFLTEAAPFYIPTSNARGFSRLPSLAHAGCRVSFTMDAPVGTEWHLSVALVCVSLRTSGAEPLFMHSLAGWMSSLEKCLLKLSAHF